jgi:hypothetical protein
MVLLKIKGKIVGHTLVQDYIYRPSEFNNISLYDWIRLSDVQKNDDIQDDLDDSGDHENDNNNNSDNGDEEKMYYRFQKHHPLYHSHYAALVPPNEEWIPNFVGGAIP